MNIKLERVCMYVRELEALKVCFDACAAKKASHINQLKNSKGRICCCQSVQEKKITSGVVSDLTLQTTL